MVDIAVDSPVPFPDYFTLKSYGMGQRGHAALYSIFAINARLHATSLTLYPEMDFLNGILLLEVSGHKI